MNKRLVFTAAVLLCASASGVSAAPAANSVAEPVGSYQLKRRSEFKAPENNRAPFWPIGFVKEAASAAPAAGALPVDVTAAFDPSQYAVTSISLGNPSLAIVNGRAYGEGEYVRSGKGAQAKTVSVDPRTRVRVMRIADGSVTLQRGDAKTITVQLRRPELREPKAEPEAELNLQ